MEPPELDEMPLPFTRVEINLGNGWRAGEVSLTFDVILDTGESVQFDFSNTNAWRFEAPIGPTTDVYSSDSTSPVGSVETDYTSDSE